MNSTFTSVEKLYDSSLLENTYAQQDEVLEEDTPISVLEAGFLFSIELNREKIRTDLGFFYEFNHSNKELDFISNHRDLYELMPSIGEFLSKQFGGNSTLCLELMEEENNWQTLFINIFVHKDSDWQKANEIIDSFYDNMFDLYPTVMEKLNIDLTLDAV